MRAVPEILRRLRAHPGLAVALALGLTGCPDDPSGGTDTDAATDATDATDGTDDAEVATDSDSAAEVDSEVATEVSPDVDDDGDDADDSDGELPGELTIASGDRCGALTPVLAPALPFTAEGDTTTANDDYIYTTGDACGGPAGQGINGDASPDLVYAFTPASTATYRIALTPAEGFDPAVMVTDACPPIGEDGFASLSCLGVSDLAAGREEVVTAELVAGHTYFVLVDGWSNDAPVAGAFALSIAIGEDCDDGVDNDANGAADCADAQCAGEERCDEATYDGGCGNDVDDDGDGDSDCADDDCAEEPSCDEAAVGACDNDLDDEGDGLTDCADPDCDDAAGCDEAKYEGGCDNGSDDDGDGQSDCDDGDCGRAPACLVVGETCETAPELALGVAVEGTTVGRTSDYGTDVAGCALSTSGSDSFGAAAPDAAYRFTPAEAGRYLFETTTDFDDALTVTAACDRTKGGMCYGVERSGTGGERLVVELAAGEPVWVIVDGWSDASASNAGDFSLTVSKATPSRAELVCDDGVDSDNDNDVDCEDVDCAFDLQSCVEAGHCDDGLDNDNDEAIDCDDSDCRSDIVACPPPPGDNCAGAIAITTVGEPVELDTCELRVDFNIGEDAGCLAPTLDSPDAVLSFTAPAAGLYLVESQSNEFSSILDVVIGDVCPGLALNTCQGSSDDFDVQRVSLDLAAGETAWFIVAGYGDEWFDEIGCGAVELAVYEVEPEVCDDALDNDRDGDLDCDDSDCDEAPACNEARAGAGSCEDGLDNDNDQLVDCFDGDCATTAACPDGVPGDACAGALEAGGDTWRLTVDTCAYNGDFVAEEVGGCQSSTSTAPRDMVVRYDVAAAGKYRVELLTGVAGSSSYDALINVVIGDTCPASPLTSCAGGSDSGNPERVDVNAAAGDTLWVIGGGWGTGCGMSTMSIVRAVPEVCDDGVDNDLDNVKDCADSDCKSVAACIEVCDDDLDNDVDGDTDCEDDECVGTGACDETANGPDACRDGEDDDGDRLLDCFDPDCFESADCDGAPGDTCASALEVTTADGPWRAVIDTCAYASDFSRTSGSGCTSMGNAGDAVAHLVATASAKYLVKVTTGIGDSATFDTVIDVFGGATCPATAAGAGCVASADDEGSGDGSEAIELLATADTTYWIAVDGYSSGCGIAEIVVTEVTPEVCDDAIDNDGDGATDCDDAECRAADPVSCPVPAGETCAGAIVVDQLPFDDGSRNLCGFTHDYEADDEDCWAYSGPEVVYSYTATTAVDLLATFEAFDDSGDTLDTVLSVNDVCPGGTLLAACLETADDSSGLAETLAISVGAGETVYFFAGTYYGTDCGAYRFQIEAE